MQRFVTLLLVISLYATSYLKSQEPIKVACVGNSITYGWELPESYPVMLGKMLGGNYEVRNFGENSRTVLNKGDYPYMKSKVFFRALEFLPDIVIIKLGTNDSKPENWQYGEDFEKDINSLITIFQNLPTNPEIYLCYPAKVYASQWGISNDVIVNEIIPAINKIATKKELRVIDLHTVTDGMENHFPDKIHPDSEGAAVIAENIYKAIVNQ